MANANETPQPTIIQQLTVRKSHVSSLADKQQTDERQESTGSFQEEFLQQHLDALAALPTHNLSAKKASYYVRRQSSYSRMGAVLDLRPRMSYSKWLTVLGKPGLIATTSESTLPRFVGCLVPRVPCCR
jgi:hypothetical protein